MEEDIKEIGDKIKCMVMVFINGLMEELITVNIMMTRKMERENIFGQVERYLKENG